MNRLAVSLCVGFCLSALGAGTSESQTTSLVHSFTGAATDGDEPNSLIEAQDGNYYGTTALGGNAGSCTDSNNKTVGCGTIFRLSSGSVTVLYSFSGGADGGSPTGLIQGPDGNLYGTTSFGGSSQGNGNCLAGTVDTGCGTIFEISPSSPPASGKLTPIYNFTGGSDGAYPNPPTMGASGVIYGSALVCSQCKTSFAYGVLFSFSPAGASAVTPTILSIFGTSKGQNGSSFAYPNGLVQATAQTLYGTAQLGGDTTHFNSSDCLYTGSNSFGCGGVFAYNLSTNKESDLCIFDENANPSSTSSSSIPIVPLKIAAAAFLPQTIVSQSSGRFPTNGNPWSFSSAPMTVTIGGDGNIYGATPPACVSGESSSSVIYTVATSCTGNTGTQSNPIYDAPPTVFQCIPPASAAAKLNTVYAFGVTNTSGSVIDGGGSLQGLMLASDGNYYGTSGVYTFDLTPTQMASFTSSSPPSPFSSLSPFYSTLASNTAGFSPNSMTQGDDGNFYGTTATGGQNSDGAVFEVSTSLKAPVQLSLQQSQITQGGSTTLDWTVPNAYSLTAQQCYAFVQNNKPGAGTWTGIQAGTLSGSNFGGSMGIQPTAAGMFTYALTCGGNVSGFATLQVNQPPAATPTFSPPPSTYTSSQMVTISDTTPGATIYYTTNGTMPTTSSTKYSGPVTVSSTETLEAIATASGYSTSAVATAAYTITPPAATPTFSPAAGTYTATQTVSISDTTPGATIYYTTNGTAPTTSSTVYSGPIGVSSTETLEAIATASGYSASAVATAVYTINIPSNPVPAISSMSPAFASAGGGQFSLTITGSGFVSNSTAFWGTTALSTQYTSSTVLTAQVPATDLASAGITPITVKSPAPGGGTSNILQFEVDSATAGSTPAPSFTVVSFTVAPGATATYPVTLSSSATNVSVTCLNLPSGATCSYSATTGALTISTSSSTPAGTYQITAVFTETLPGASSAVVIVPMLLLPLMLSRKRWASGRIRLAVCLGSVFVIAAAVSGCGGGGGGGGGTTQGPQTHQVTISGSVSLTVQ
jgi:hypothetical protein